jgi:hypothetical protein
LVWPPVVLWLVAHSELTKGSRGPWGPALHVLPGWTRRLVIALFGLLAIGWLSSLPWVLRGNPEQQGSTYVLFNHGDVTVVSQSDYESSMAAHDRFVAAILTGFYLGAFGTLRARRLLASDMGQIAPANGLGEPDRR